MDAPIPKEVSGEWERYFETDGQRQPGLDVYGDIFENGYLFPLQRQREMALMMQAARAIEPRVVLEIGSDKGGGFYHWIKGQPSVKRAFAIEVRGVPWGDNFRKAFPEIEFHFYAASSYAQATVDEVRRDLGSDAFDCIFIDGDKARIGSDFDIYSGMVRRGGLIFIHDILDNHVEPSRFFRLAERTSRTQRLIDTSEGVEAHERQAKGDPVTSAYEGWLRHWAGTSCGVGVIQV